MFYQCVNLKTFLYSFVYISTRCIFYKQLLNKLVSTGQDKKLSNCSTGWRNAKQFEHFSSDPIGKENRAVPIEK